ncbi:MAG TPA: carboxypeptidase M32 [Gaiellaceae bacterium]|nr:carboxypeptidase M32 [Gaiellaceae bacterium]
MSDGGQQFEQLLRRLGEVNDVDKAMGLLVWDEETKMPPLGAAARAEQRATLARIAHELEIDPALGELLENLRGFEAEHEPESFEASVIRIARRDHEKNVRVPAELRAEMTRNASLGYRAWLEARERKDFGVLLPCLERSLELMHRYVACFDHDGDPYDVLLDEYEPGMTAAEVDAVFDRLKAELIPMVASVAEPVDDSCLHGRFPVDAQRRFSLAVLAAWGMDGDAWRLDGTVHPFAGSMAPTDIRLTTNFHEDSLHGVLSCMHEFGHGLYERQVDPRFTRTPLARGVSSAFHESQSRLWENLVGRNRATWEHFYPRLRDAFPEHFADVSVDTFHRALNKVEPTMRRVDSDEVTYCLHIVLRFELERQMLSGEVALADLPDAFDAKMREYLGLTPADAVEGVLQDVHWSEGGFGYFPTYALGNVISVQLWRSAEEALGDLDAQFARGEFAPLREWLGEHVHRPGRTLEPQALLERVTGSRLDPEPYLGYLRGKLETLAVGVR